ncbi:MAG: SPOR domain-containing protein [Bacteroidales bacterium]|nr:SPOR domain-containing protein [Bacteroidales bacterium]
MKKLIYVFTFFSAFVLNAGLDLGAQEVSGDGKSQYKDSIVFKPATTVDSQLSGKDILHIMPSRQNGDKADVNVYQSAEVSSSLKAHISANNNRTISGYRVRIFFDNKQTARVESEEALKKFNVLYPGIAAYRTYANPYFKVTVGDFRTKSEAMEMLTRIRREFPSAFVVKESVNYPVVDKAKPYVIDTLKVLVPQETSMVD